MNWQSPTLGIAALGVCYAVYRLALRHERGKVAALFLERGAVLAHAGLGLTPTDAPLPPDVASSVAFRGNDCVIGRPLRGTWEGGELLCVEHGYMAGADDDDESRHYRVIFAFRLPDESQGYTPLAPWSAETIGDWLVLRQPGGETPLTTAEVAAQLESARAFARRTLL